MNNFHIKSIILGIGIGVILTSIVSMVYLAGTYPVKALSDSEIISRAKQLGMVEEDSLLDTGNSEKEQNTTDSNKETDNAANKENDSKNQSDDTNQALPQKKIKLEIAQGDTSEIVADKLLDSGLIASKEIFLDELKDMKLETRINIGEFSINEGIDIKTIIRIITEKK